MVATNPGIENLVSWWSFDETSGNALDSHGTNHLVETSGTIQSAAGSIGNARDIERGDSEWFAVADNDSIDLGGKDFSVGVRFKVESWASTGNWLVNKRGGSTTEFQIYVTQYTIRGSVYDSVSESWVTALFEGDFETGAWYLAMLTYDDTSKTVSIHLSGNVATETKAGMEVASGDSALVFGTGAWNLGDSGTTHDGMLDEGFLYTKCLTRDNYLWLSSADASYAEVAGITGDAFLMNWW